MDPYYIRAKLFGDKPKTKPPPVVLPPMKKTQSARVHTMESIPVPTDDNDDEDDNEDDNEDVSSVPVSKPRKRRRYGFLYTCFHRQDRKLIAFAFAISTAMIALEGVWFGTGTSTVVFIGLGLEILVYLFAFCTNREEEEKDLTVHIGLGGLAVLKSFVVLVMLITSLLVDPKLVLHIFVMIFECVYVLTIAVYRFCNF